MKKLNNIISCNFDINVTGISTNTKTIEKGNLFICTKGAKVDRHNYIKEAIEKGASALITNHDIEENIPYVKVNNTNKILPQLCQKFYDYPNEKLEIFAVTGTDGKTSTATIIQTLIGNNKCGYIGTNGRNCYYYNKPTDNTTPAPEELYKYMQEFIDSGCKSLAMEASSEAMLNKRLDNLFFNVVGITNITSEHLNNHGSLENYVECKKQIMTLTKENGYSILNKDDSYYEEIRKICKGKTLSYGKELDNDLIIKDYSIFSNYTEITFTYKNKDYNFNSPLLGEFNIYNLACAMLMCLSQNYPIEELLKNVPNIKISGRLDTINKGQNYTVMIDYAHTPNGITKLLEFIKILDKNRIITVIGQAGERDAYKRKEVGKIIADNSDIAIFTYEDPRSEDPLNIINDMTENIRNYNNYEIIIDRSKAIEYAINIAKENDIVLVLGKGNETYEKLKDKTIYFNDTEEATKYIIKRIEKEKIHN